MQVIKIILGGIATVYFGKQVVCAGFAASENVWYVLAFFIAAAIMLHGIIKLTDR